MMMDGCGGGMVLWSLFLLALIGGGIWLAVRAFRGDDRGPATGEQSSARQVLDERYARGELDDDEYERRRRILE